MPLFVCKKCKHIDNTALVCSPKIFEGLGIDEVNTKKTELREKGYPCMSLMDMFGAPGNNINSDKICMLCCKCNTGHDHGSFIPQLANEAELEIASHSEEGFITPSMKLTGLSEDLEMVEDPTQRYGFSIKRKGEHMSRENNMESTRGAVMASGLFAPLISTLLASKHYKSPQSEDEKKLKLRLAELKRELKAAKRKGADANGINAIKALMEKVKNS